MTTVYQCIFIYECMYVCMYVCRNPSVCMCMQNKYGFEYTRGVLKRPWASSWTGPQTVYFGHDAARGLQRHPNALGVDTGGRCMYVCMYAFIKNQFRDTPPKVCMYSCKYAGCLHMCDLYLYYSLLCM